MRYFPLASFLVLAGVVPTAVNGQQPGEIAMQTLPPIIVPWELGGPEFVFHTRELDSASFPAHNMAGNVWYVGQADYVSYLVTSPQGHILIGTTYESGVPLIQKSVEQLPSRAGYPPVRFQDIKIILLINSRPDQAGGAARLKELTGAQLMVMEQDAKAVEDGVGVPAVKIDRVLHDKDEVRLGGTIITAYRTPARTPGNTTYVWKTQDKGDVYSVVLMGDMSSDARSLVDPAKPAIVEDYRYSFHLLKTLPCDIFLGAYGKFFNLREKYPVLAKRGASGPYIDPDAYDAHIKLMEKSFYYKLNAAHRQPGQ